MDFIGALNGWTVPSISTEKGYVFLETTRDSVAANPGNTEPAIALITAHEIMHLLRGNGKHDDIGIGQSEPDLNSFDKGFAPIAIYEIRHNTITTRR
jgi:hypothetical protein